MLKATSRRSSQDLLGLPRTSQDQSFPVESLNYPMKIAGIPRLSLENPIENRSLLLPSADLIRSRVGPSAGSEKLQGRGCPPTKCLPSQPGRSRSARGSGRPQPVDSTLILPMVWVLFQDFDRNRRLPRTSQVPGGHRRSQEVIGSLIFLVKAQENPIKCL